MKITVGNLLKASDALRPLRPETIDGKMDLARLLHSIAVESEVAAGERLQLFQRYGTQQGQSVIVPPDKMVEFTPAIRELMATVVDISPIPINRSLLELLSVGDLESILPLIE